MKAKVTESVFRCVKKLAENGMRNEDICKAMGISKVTISRVRRAETLEEYNQIVVDAKKATKLNKLKAEQPEEPEAPVKSEAKEDQKPVNVEMLPQGAVTKWQVDRLLEAMKEQNELLKLISAKVLFIVEQLA